jgi:hypothetical protein
VHSKRKDWAFPVDWSDDQISEFILKLWEKKEAAADRALARRLAKEDAKYAENLAKVPELVTIFQCPLLIVTDIAEKARLYDLSDKQVALAAKIHAEWVDWEAGAADRAAAAEELAYVGEIGEKIALAVTVDAKVGIETRYGWTTLVIFLTEEGNRVKTFTTAAFVDDLEVGDAITITAKVKAHEVYEDQRETLVTHPKPLVATN